MLGAGAADDWLAPTRAAYRGPPWRSVFLSSLRSLRRHAAPALFPLSRRAGLAFIVRAPARTINGAPERIRTSDPQIRSLVLYPAELRALLEARSYIGELCQRQAPPGPGRGRARHPRPVPAKYRWKRADFPPKRHCDPLSPPAPLVKTGRHKSACVHGCGWGWVFGAISLCRAGALALRRA